MELKKPATFEEQVKLSFYTKREGEGALFQ